MAPNASSDRKRAVRSSTIDVTHLNRRLYTKLRGEIVTGHFSLGSKLPSTRALAASLGVSRNTVVKAFEQLTEEGYLQGRGGSGSYVADELPDNLIQPKSKASGGRIQASSPLGLRTDSAIYRAHRFARDEAIRPFMPGIPALDAFPYAVWTKLLERHWKRRHPGMLSYGDPAGFSPLREAICSYLAVSRGVQRQPEQIIVVSGTQQALNLLSQVLLTSGDSAWVEEPGYFAASAAFEAAGAKVIPVQVDSDGLDVSAGIAADPRARVVYTMPGHQFPTGASMSVTRRQQLLRWASKSKAWILEDDYDSEFSYTSRPLPALQSLDRDSNVIYIGSFSKMLFPALRLGYIVVPSGLIAQILTAKFLADWHSSTIDQALVAKFISEGHLLRHVRKTRALYLERLEALLASAHSELNGAVNIVRPDRGMHVVASLPAGTDDRAVAADLDRTGVSSLPMSLCYLGRNRTSALILGFAAYTPKQIEQGCRQFAAALAKVPVRIAL